MVEEHTIEQEERITPVAAAATPSPPTAHPPPNPKHYKVSIKAVRVDLQRVEVPRGKWEEAGCRWRQVEEEVERTDEGGDGEGKGEGARDEENNLLVVPVMFVQNAAKKIHEKALMAERRQKVVMREKLQGVREVQVPRMVEMREVAGQVVKEDGLVVGSGDHQVTIVVCVAHCTLGKSPQGTKGPL